MSVNYGGILKHYLLVALTNSGTRIDSDTHVELDLMVENLEAHIRQVVRDEIRRAIASKTEV